MAPRRAPGSRLAAASRSVRQAVTESVRILGIAAGGEGVGRLDDGLTVFVPRAAPGDLVALSPVDRRKRFGRATIGQVLEASPERVEPRCLHYVRDRCGGCQLQHLTVEAGRAAKRRIVGEALRRIGHLELADPPIEPAPSDWGYRTKITLAGDPTGKRIGYHQVDRPDRVFDLEQCHIAEPVLQQLWTGIREHRRLLPSPVAQIILRLDRARRRHAIVVGQTEEAWTRAGELGQALDQDGIRATLWWQPRGGRARVMAGEGKGLSPTAFEQVNPAVGDRIRKLGVEALGDIRGKLVWDLYAGIGETTNLLVERGATVESIERDALPRPTRAAKHLMGLAEDRVSELSPPDCVMTNPPRTGMAPEVVDVIRDRAPPLLVYLSCDPATLARDLARLVQPSPAGLSPWSVRSVQAFDMFPQTAHVETVTVLAHP
jgi:23S rRNA (uracil1939-C5)-methyltransferase